MSPDRQRVLLSGGTGFIGSVLAKRLLERGHSVLALVRSNPERGVLPDAVKLSPWPESQNELRSLVASEQIDACLHLAAHFVAEHAASDVAALVESNVGLTAAIADAAAAGGAKRMIFAGTVWQNAAGAEYQPVSLYAATKQASQDILMHFSANSGLEVMTLKLPDTYGPKDTRRKAMDLLLEVARTGSSLAMSPGMQILDLLHVDDVADAFILATETTSTPPAGVAALTSGEPITLRDLADTVAAVTGRQLPIQWGARPYRGKEKFDAWDAGPALDGWQPRIELAEGISQLWAL